MFSYQPQIFENNQWQALSPWARPFTDGTALNDVLDAGCINLSLSSRYNPIKPFTPICIIISEDGVEVDRIYRLVSSTKRTRRTFAPSVGAKYDWTINTIELTKAMERRFIGTLTSTKYLHTDYATGTSIATGVFSDESTGTGYQTPTYNNTIKNPNQSGNITIPSCRSSFTLGSRGRWYNEDYNHPVDGKGCYAIITYPSGKTVNTGYIEKTTYTLNADEIGTYTIKGRNLSRVSEKTLKKNLALINARPKKILNYQTPTDLFEQELNKVLHLV